MRNCSACKREDRPVLDAGAICNCGAECPEPENHAAECRALIHEVVMYYVRIPHADVVFNAAGEPNISSHYRSRGWYFMRNGERFYRVKTLCRPCIELEEEAQARKRDYEKACKAARGIDDQTYSQMLAQCT